MDEKQNIKIQTHDGKFHCDDVTAISLLTNYYGQNGYDVSVIRSREISEDSDIFVDVGGQYDPENLKFDHHQESCDEKWTETSKIPLSSVGMIWKHYGKEIVEINTDNLSEEHIEEIVNIIYYKIIQEIDGSDNGINMIEGGERNYWSNLNLPSIVASCNGDDEEQNVNFDNAVRIVDKIFEIKFKNIITNYLNYNHDLQLVEQSELYPELGYIILNTPVKSIYKCLNELDPEYKIKFIITIKGDQFSVRTRSRKGEMFTNMVDIIPKNKLLEMMKYPEELIFVHKNLFIAKTSSLNCAIDIVELSLIEHNNLMNRFKRIIHKPYAKIAAGVGTLGLVGYFYYSRFEE